MNDDADKRRAAYEARQQHLAGVLATLPPAAAEHFGRWRRCVELCGRASNGNQLEHVIAFAESIARVASPSSAPAPVPSAAPVMAAEQAGRVAGEHTPGPGW